MGDLINDTIYRQAAIDALCRRCDLVSDGTPCTEKCNDIKILEMLPSAQPELIERTAYIRGFEQGRTQGMIDSQGGKNMIKAEWTNADALNLQPTCNQLATDTISRQAAIDEVKHYIEIGYDSDIIHTLENLPFAQPKTEERTAESAQNVSNGELISKKAAIDALIEWYGCKPNDIEAFEKIIEALPSAQPEQQRMFVELVVEYPEPELCTYKEYKGKPYYSIKYIKNGETYIGYGTYNPKVLSQYLSEYFISFAQPDTDKWCTDCKEYDSEKHCCPRFNRVIKDTLKEVQPEIVRCGECKYMTPEGRCLEFADDCLRPSVSDFCSRAERREE